MEKADKSNSLPISLLKQLLDSGHYSDFIIECEGKDFKVHRAIVCTASPILSKLCNSPFKEGTTGRGSLNETKAETFERALRYVYTAVYMIADSEDICDEEALLQHIELYVVADFLQVESLKVQALNHSIDVLSKLRASMIQIPKLQGAIAYAFNRTSKEDYALRKPILQACAKAYQSIKQTEIEELLYEEEALAWTLAKESQLQYNAAIEEHRAQVTEIRAFTTKLQPLINGQKWLCAVCGASVALILDTEKHRIQKGSSYCHCKDMQAVTPLNDRHNQIRL